MRFTINSDATITLLDADAQPVDGALVISNSKEFTHAVIDWPMHRMVAAWNQLAPRLGLREVQKFENIQKGGYFLWCAVTAVHLGMSGSKLVAKIQNRSVRMTPGRHRAPTPESTTAPRPRAGKSSGNRTVVIEMISQPGGATLDAIMELTSWQAHTVRAFMSTLPSKGGPHVVSKKNGSVRIYEAVTA